MKEIDDFIKSLSPQLRMGLLIFIWALPAFCFLLALIYGFLLKPFAVTILLLLLSLALFVHGSAQEEKKSKDPLLLGSVIIFGVSIFVLFILFVVSIFA
jgi:hypothetical protein